MRVVESMLSFLKPVPKGAEGRVSGGVVSAPLYEEEATSHLLRMLTRLPEVDEVLRQAGVTRNKLRVLLYDDEIAQACETRLDALAAVPMRLEPTEGAGADLIRDILKPVLDSALAGVFSARLFGYSVMEAVWYERQDQRIGLKFLGEKPLEWFEPKSDGRLVLYPDDGSAQPGGIELDQRFKFFLTRVRPTYRNPYGEALLSRLYWPWYFRTNGWKFWGKFLERFGSPLLVGKSDNPTAMVAALLLAHSQAVIGVGRDDDVRAEGVPSGNSGGNFDLFETACVRRIQKVVLGQTLTSGTDGGSGNRALGQVHNSVREDKRNSDIVLAVYTLQRIVDAICELNRLERHQVFFADDVGLELERAERDTKLYAMGVRFEAEYIQDNYELRETDFKMTTDTPRGSEGLPPPLGSDKPAKPTKASKQFTRHAPSSRFTRQQQAVEDLADSAQVGDPQPLPLDAVRSAVLAATSPEDLEDRLFALVGDQVAHDDFIALLERALFAADVLGYVHAAGKV